MFLCIQIFINFGYLDFIMGNEYHPADIAVIASFGAIEIDNYLRGKSIDFENVQKLAEILRKYPVEEFFSYVPLLNAFRDKSSKKMKTISEVALETRLFVLELEDVPSDNEKLKELRSALCDISRGFLRETKSDYRAVA